MLATAPTMAKGKPKKTQETTSVRIGLQLARRLDTIASWNGKTREELVAEVLSAYVVRAMKEAGKAMIEEADAQGE
jgi:predicted DNA-binding protein